MSWEFDRDRPIYAQLVEQLQRAIVSGAYAPGARFRLCGSWLPKLGSIPTPCKKR